MCSEKLSNSVKLAIKLSVLAQQLLYQDPDFQRYHICACRHPDLSFRQKLQCPVQCGKKFGFISMFLLWTVLWKSIPRIRNRLSRHVALFAVQQYCAVKHPGGFHSKDHFCDWVSVTKRFACCGKTRNVLDLLLTRKKKKKKKMGKHVNCFYPVVWCQVQGTAQWSVGVKGSMEHLFLEEAAVVIIVFTPWSSQ